jgi:hypothetical protein
VAGVVAEPGYHDGVERPVELPVTRAVQPVPGDLTLSLVHADLDDDSYPSRPARTLGFRGAPVGDLVRGPGRRRT